MDRLPRQGQQVRVRILFDQPVLHSVRHPGEQAVVPRVPENERRVGDRCPVNEDRILKGAVQRLDPQGLLRHVHGIRVVPIQLQADPVPEQHRAGFAPEYQFAFCADVVVAGHTVYGIPERKLM